MAINTFAPVKRRPTLVAIDGARGTFRRYWPKYPSGFLVDEALLPEGQYTADILRQLVEKFREKGFADA